MARLGVTKKKKSPRTTKLSQLKKEVQRLTDQLKSCQQELTQKTAELETSSPPPHSAIPPTSNRLELVVFKQT